MSDELVVDPAALTKFATDLEGHIGKIQDVLATLSVTGGGQGGGGLFGDFAGQEFGDFDGAREINQRSGQLLGEMNQRLTSVTTSLGNLRDAAKAAAAAYHGSDHLSASSIATIDDALDAFDSSAAAAPGGRL